jgi:hypothetical protein
LFLTRLPNVYLIKNTTNVVWAGYDTVKAVLCSIQEILDSGRKYDYIHLMSGQDYPIKKPSQILNFFQQNAGKEFLRYENFDNWDGEGYERIHKYQLVNYSFPGRYFIEKLVNKWLPKRIPPQGIEFYGYSMFWALTPPPFNMLLTILIKIQLSEGL